LTRNAEKSFNLNRHRMGSQKKLDFRGHSLGTVTMKLNKKGISFYSANPLNIHGAGIRIEATRSLSPAGF
jgi:hypothetical protein